MTTTARLRKIGCFEVTPLEKGRWRVRNLKTNFEHVTYGTAKELKIALMQQTEAWERKFADDKAQKGVRGSAWRKKHNAEWKQAVAARKAAATAQ